MTADHLYTVTVWPVQVAWEATFEAADLDLPLNASAEQALYYAEKMINDDPLAFIPVPTNLLVVVEREDGDTYSGALAVDVPNDEDDDE